jgi:hypothetical protein
MAFTVILVLVFGAAALVPAVLITIGIFKKEWGFWPGLLGIGFAVLLLTITFVNIGKNWGCKGDWGKCSNSNVTSKDTIVCVTGNVESGCKPDIWKVECGKPSGCTAAIPPGKFCPKGQTPVFPFCEEIHSNSPVKQPWATWSDLSFVAAGLWLLWFLHYFWRPGDIKLDSKLNNPMITIGCLSVIYGLVAIFMGPPSMWYHASMMEWAGWFDSMSVVTWLSFNAIYVLYALVFAMWGRGREMARPITILCTWGSLIVTFGIIGWNYPNSRLVFYFISGGLWGIVEVIYLIVGAACGKVKYRRSWWLFVCNFLLLGLTMGIWCWFNPGIVSPIHCHSREGIPGHAFFHILASFSTILTFVSFASERKIRE